MTEKKKCENHKGHMCVLVSEQNWDEIKRVVTDPEFICFNCGRVANSAKNLCNPMPLKKSERD